MSRLRAVHGDASAMNDVMIRTKLASLPEVVHDTSLLAEVKG